MNEIELLKERITKLENDLLATTRILITQAKINDAQKLINDALIDRLNQKTLNGKN